MTYDEALDVARVEALRVLGDAYGGPPTPRMRELLEAHLLVHLEQFPVDLMADVPPWKWRLYLRDKLAAAFRQAAPADA